MKKYLLSIALIFILSLDINAHVGHYSKYSYLEYELYRNNKPIGFHKYNFKRTGENLTVDNEVSFKITKLGVDLYKYYAKGVEKYKNGIFSGFYSETNQNKKEKYVKITVDPIDKNLFIDGSSFKGKVDKEMIIGTWWNHEIVSKKAQISAVSGRIIEQKVEFIRKEDVKIGEKVYKTLRFNFSSSDPSLSKDKKLNTDIWYEEDTFLWVKAAFDKKGENETFNITTGSGRTILSYAKILKKYFKKVKFKIVSRDKTRPKRGTLSIKKAKKLLNYKPKFNLEKGTYNYVEFVKGLKNINFEGAARFPVKKKD